MGEAVQEEAKAEAAPEEKEEKKEKKKEEEAGEKKEEKPPSPPPPVILFVDLHCVGCTKKIERCIMKYRGVEGVEMDTTKNQVTIKGVVNPQDLCSRIKKRTMREAKVLSPTPPQEGEQQGADQVVASQVGGITTVELNVNMHCDACAQQLRRKILKMRGVQTAETEPSSGKVTVTGTMDADRLVEYVYRRTRKQAKIVPQPPPPPPPATEEEKKQDEEKPPSEEKKTEAPKEGEKKEGEENKEGAEKADGEEKPEGDGGGKEEKPEGDGGGKEEKPAEGGDGGDGEKKGGEGGEPIAPDEGLASVEDDLKKMMYNWAPIYVVERLPPPPQIFSDENPNACCIS